MRSSKSAPRRRQQSKAGRLADLRLLRTFIALGDTGNMTVAASRLGLTQSAVSQSVRHLEDLFGAVLLDRTSRPLVLTTAGALVYREARVLIDDADALVAMVRHTSPHRVPDLRMGVVDSFGATVGPSLIKSLLPSAVRLTFRSGLAQDQSRALLARELDLIVTSDPMDDLDGFERRRLLSEPFLLLLPPGLSGRSATDLKLLASQHPLVRFSERSLIGAQIERHLRRLGVRSPRTLEVDATDALMSMVSAGVGWGIVTPLCLLQVRGQLSRLTTLPFPGTQLYRQLYLIWRTKEYGDFPLRAAERACEILETEVAPPLLQGIPWLKGQFVIG